MTACIGLRTLTVAGSLKTGITALIAGGVAAAVATASSKQRPHVKAAILQRHLGTAVYVSLLVFLSDLDKLFSASAVLWLQAFPPFGLTVALVGLAGSVLDSVLGALFQATVEDGATHRVVEGENGRRVPVVEGGSRVQRGRDWLNNNGVNFVMAAGMSLVAMVLLPVPG